MLWEGHLLAGKYLAKKNSEEEEVLTREFFLEWWNP